MKTKILLYIAFFVTTFSLAQTNTIGFGQGVSLFDAPAGTYIKDINNDFNKFDGIWKYQNGNQILIFKLEKVEMYHNIENDIYEDFMIGNYSFSLDGGLSYVVNTINQNIGIYDPELNPLYACCPYNINTSIRFSFKDIVYNKPSCDARFTFENGNLNELRVKLTNRGRGYILPDVPPTPNFSIPNNVVLIKQ
jgi:hypothetical protein